MKMLKKLSLIVLAFFCLKVNAQTDKVTTAKIIAEKNYIFTATNAVPMSSKDMNAIFSKMTGSINAGNISLTGSGYDVKISPDSIIAYLPYYGRAYSAPISNDDNGFKFTSKDFSYVTEKHKKGGWQITILPKDTKESPRLSLNVSESGYGTLIINSNNKQSITYNGYLSEVKKTN